MRDVRRRRDRYLPSSLNRASSSGSQSLTIPTVPSSIEREFTEEKPMSSWTSFAGIEPYLNAPILALAEAGRMNDTDDEIGDDLPDPDQIISIHATIEEEYDLTHRGAAVVSPRLKFGFSRTSTNTRGRTNEQLLSTIITAHYFEDGNKRTAWATTRLYLEDRGTELAVKETQAVKPILANIRIFEIEELAEWLANGHIDDSDIPSRT
jgi:death-on-curing protein